MMTIENLAATAPTASSLAGTPRLRIIAAVSALCSVYFGLVEYALPLYFPAKGLPTASWETWGLLVMASWAVGPFAAGVLTRLLGECRCWALGLTGYVFVPALLVALPRFAGHAEAVVAVTALTYGISASIIWIGGLSLVQSAPDQRRGLSNALFLSATGVGAFCGPLLGRLLLHVAQGPTPNGAQVFTLVWVALAAIAVLGAALVSLWGRRPSVGTPAEECAGEQPGVGAILREGAALMHDRGFAVTVIALGLLGGPIFQAGNVYRAYRAAEPFIGLIAGSRDHGWAGLQATGYAMQLVAGLAVGLVVGRGRPALIGAATIAAFSLSAVWLGLAPSAAFYFGGYAAYEGSRQFMRWAQTSLISEQVSETSRPAAMSWSVLASSLGGTVYNLIVRALQSPGTAGFSTALPFLLAAGCGALGAVLLAVGLRHTSKTRST